MTEPDDEVALVVSVTRACEMLAVSKPTLHKLLRRGVLRSYKDGHRSRKIEVASIKAYVERRIKEDQHGTRG